MEQDSANSRQVGGEHYRKLNADLQHWDLVALTGMGYFEGQITRYVARWRRKNGVQDLQKAIHYTDKLIELVHSGKHAYHVACPLLNFHFIAEFAKHQQLTREELDVFVILVEWTTVSELEKVKLILQGMLNAPLAAMGVV